MNRKNNKRADHAGWEREQREQVLRLSFGVPGGSLQGQVHFLIIAPHYCHHSH